MAVLVTAASKHGSTEDIGREIVLGLRAHDIYAEFIRPEDVRDLDEYDAVIIGSAVYAGHWIEPATTFVDTHKAALRERAVWVFSSGPVGDPPKPQEDPMKSADIKRIVRAVGARDHHVFAGRLNHDELSFVERAVVKAVHTGDGDFRDWSDVRDWTDEIARTLAGAVA